VGLTTIKITTTRLMPTLLFNHFLIAGMLLRYDRAFCASIWIF